MAQGRPSEKPVLDTSVLENWPSVGTAALSNNGQYAFYTINHQPKGENTLVIQALKGTWKRTIVGAGSAVFTNDSHKALFLMPNDSLCLLSLGEATIEWLLQVRSFRLFQLNGSDWLACQLNNEARELVLRNISTGQQQSFLGVVGYTLSEKGHVLVVQRESKQAETITQSLDWVPLPEGKGQTIWTGTKASNLVMDGEGKQLAFMASSLWYYQAGTHNATILAADRSKGIDSNLKISKINFFSNDGNRLFIALKEQERPPMLPDAVKVDVWSYRDVRLQSEQLQELAPRSFDAVVVIANRLVIRLLQENDERVSYSNHEDNYVVVVHRKGAIGEEKWNTTSRRSYFLVSTLDGTRKDIKLGRHAFWGLSPSGRFVVGGGANNERDIFCYDRQTEIIHNLTGGISGQIDSIFDDVVPLMLLPVKRLDLAGWLADGTSLLLYDRYDIWQVNLLGKPEPINLTNGYGRRHRIVFRLTTNYNIASINTNEPLTISAFNRVNKTSGYYRMQFGKSKDPKCLSLGPFDYLAIYKARDTGLYLAKRSTAGNSPNWFTTADFTNFVSLSQVNPEAKWNWLKTELLTWKALDGHPEQGILYKPENFDPQKQYPVIITYYEKRSDELYEYKEPAPIQYDINIPWFVSRGYLIFVPDIYYEIGSPGKGIYNSVISGTKLLMHYSWVNPQKIGIQGHSWGGYETNYLITHTHIFSAAMASSGVSDFVTNYGSLQASGYSFQFKYELGQYRIGKTLWERPDLYIANSPVFRADKVTTPLLMMNNKNDASVPFVQGVEFFTALRRLGKKVWMLQYDDGNHLAPSGKAALQHTIRTTQFFDYYLKGTQPPLWMTQGIAAAFKGWYTGLEFDFSGSVP